MTTEVGLEDDELRTSSLWSSTPVQGNNDRVHLNQLDPDSQKLIEKTMNQITAISGHQPHALDPSLIGRVVNEVPELQAKQDLLNNLESLRSDLKSVEDSGTLEFPRLAWEAVQLGLAKEKYVNDQINAHVKEADKMQKQIDKLLDLNAELGASKDHLTDRAKEILKDLKNEGIDIWKHGSDENKQNISELKSLSSSHMDKLRSGLQVIFTTKIQVLIQMISSIMEIMKDIVRQNNRLVSMILQKSTTR